LAIAKARVEQARGASRETLADSLPSLTGIGAIERHLLFGTGTKNTGDTIEQGVRIPDPATYWSATLSLRQPLLALQAWHDRGTTQRAVKAAELSSADTERLILATVADNIVSVVTAERLAEISRVSLRSSLATLELTKRRSELGAASSLDVLRTEREVSLNRAQVVGADEALRRAREDLGMSLGEPVPWSVTPDIHLDSLAKDAKSLCVLVGDVNQRADVQAASMNAEVAARAKTSADYKIAPTVDFVSDLTYTTQKPTANNEHVQWTIGALLTVPFYDGGSRYGTRQQAEAGAEIARQELSQVKRQAQLDVAQASRSVGVALSNLEVSQKTRDIARETARLAQVGFENGSGTSFDLVDTARSYREAEIDLAIKEFQVIRAQIAALLAQANCNI
jgi:outer membrane protein TolC